MKSNSEYEIIDDAISEYDFFHICETITNSKTFPWVFEKEITFKNDLDSKFIFYMTHLFYYNNSPISHFFDLLEPILKRINPFTLHRIKANFYPNQNYFYEHSMHTDDQSTLGALFYLNDNNGYTKLELENGDLVKIESKGNRLLLFNSKKDHCSTNCTDDFGRFNINFNFYY